MALKSLDKMTDFEKNKELMILDGYEEKYLEKNPQNVEDYFSDYNLMIPLSGKENINLNVLEDEKGKYFSATVSTMQDAEYSNICITDSEDMLRAIGDCILKKQRI